MADKDNKEEEYEFDPFGAESEGSPNIYDETEAEQQFNPDKEALPPLVEDSQSEKSPVIRNSLILLAGIAVLVVGYRIVSGFLTKKPTPAPATVVQKPKPIEVPKQPELIMETKPVMSTPTVDAADEARKKMETQLQDLENNQKNLESQISNMQNELSSVSTTMSQLSKQIENLNQTVLTLSDKVADESIKLTALSVCAPKPKVVVMPKVTKIMVPRVYYHLKAIIPGRAWLIGTNGSTITVREGSIVPGFGVVKLIDAIQGRVFMQSGQVIEFSQQDS